MTVGQFFKIIKPKTYNDDFPYNLKVKWKSHFMYIDEYDGPRSKNWLSAFPEENRIKANFFKLETFNDLEILNTRDLIEGTFDSL